MTPVPIPVRKFYATIFESVTDGSLQDTEQFILNGTNPNSRDEMGRSPLYLAAMNIDEPMIRLLLKHGASPYQADAAGSLPIHAAARRSFETASLLAGKGDLIFLPEGNGRDSSVITRAFNQGPSAVTALLGEKLVNATDAQGNTPTHLAALVGKVDIVAALIANGADINIRNSSGLLPIDLAFANTYSAQHVMVAEELIKNYSDIPGDQRFYYAFQAISNTGVESRFENGATVLHYAAEYDHFALMSLFINRNAYLEARDEKNRTPLHIAVEQGNYAIIELLISAGADVDARNMEGATPLHLAYRYHQDVQIPRLLIEAGADIESRNIYGETPLHLSMSPEVTIEFTSLLVSSGADVDSRDKSGNTPMMTGLAKNSRSSVELLLDHGADIYQRNNNEITPLIRALMRGIDTVSWFYRPGMNNTTDIAGDTPLHIAVAIHAPLDVIAFIITSGGAVDRQNFLGDTPLHTSVEISYPEASSLLVSKHADPFLANNRGKSASVLAFEKGIEFTSYIISETNLEDYDGQGNTPLHLAALWDFPEIAAYLIDLGAETNARNTQGLTPLHYAVKNNGIKMCQILANRGASIDARDSYGNTPLHTAITWQSIQAAKFLLLRSANVQLRNLSGNTPMHTAVLQRDRDSIKMLVEYGASLESRDNMGMTPLLLAARKNYWEVSQLLIELGADFNARDDRGNTPLHEAVRNRNEATCTLLIARGADMYAENRYDDTPIGIAFAAGAETVDWFIQGNSIFARDDRGNTPLHIAIQSNASEEIIRLFIKKGADVDSRNNRINTPLHIAFQTNNKTAVEILVQAGADLFSRNGEGNSPLTIAFGAGKETMSWIINERTVSMTDQQGNTPLHIAASIGDRQAVDFLLTMGADPMMKNLAGLTSSTVAAQKGFSELARYLTELQKRP